MLPTPEGDAGPAAQPAECGSSASKGMQQRPERGSLPPTPTATDRLQPAPSAELPSSAAPLAAALLPEHCTQQEEEGGSASRSVARLQPPPQQPPPPGVALHSGAPAAAPAPAPAPAPHHLRLLSFVRCVGRSSILKAALVSHEAAGMHPAGGSAGSSSEAEEAGAGAGVGAGGATSAWPAANSLECILAQLLALHLRSGDPEGAHTRQTARSPARPHQGWWALRSCHSPPRCCPVRFPTCSAVAGAGTGNCNGQYLQALTTATACPPDSLASHPPLRAHHPSLLPPAPLQPRAGRCWQRSGCCRRPRAAASPQPPSASPPGCSTCPQLRPR